MLGSELDMGIALMKSAFTFLKVGLVMMSKIV